MSSDLESAETICNELCDQLKTLGIEERFEDTDDPRVLDKVVVLNDVANQHLTDLEKEAIEGMWGFAAVRNKRNDVMTESLEAGSAKYERKARIEQRKWLDELDSKFVGGEEEDNNQISTMTLPDLSGNSREKDIQVNNFNITFG